MIRYDYCSTIPKCAEPEPPTPEPVKTSDCFSGNVGEYQYKEGERLSITKNGFACQRWDEDYPHNARGNAPYAPKLRANNFCSDHDGEPAWCYTTDPNQRYDECDVTYECGAAAEIYDDVGDVVNEMETIGDKIVDEMVDNMLNEIPTTNMITPTTTTALEGDDYDSYTYEDSNIELPETVKTFMGDAAAKLGLDTSKEDWLSSLLNGPASDGRHEDQNETEAVSEETGSENELTLVNMLT